MSLFQDLRFALRLLLKDRWFSVVAVTALALGIGVNATVFTLVNAVLIRGLPFKDSGRLYMLGVRPASDEGGGQPISRLDFLEWRDAAPSFEALAGFARGSMTISDGRLAPEATVGVWVTGNTFDVLGQPMLIGRGFAAGDDLPGAERVVVLGYSLWQSRYGGDRKVIGRPIRVNGEPSTIIGVMPQGIKFPTNSELWVSAIPTTEQQQRRDVRYLSVFGRLRPGASVSQAQAELDRIVGHLAKTHASNKELTVAAIQTFNERFNGGNIRTVFLTLMGAVGFVLLIACGNVANLQLSRSQARAREVAVRYAMGATRWRVVRQLLVESILLGLLGGVIGLGIALVGTRLFDLAVADVGKPYWIQFTVDYVVIGYLLVICIVTGIVFGLAPALQVARTSVGSVLKQGGRGSTGSWQIRGFTSSLVVLELALTLVLLVGAGLLARSFIALASIETGVQTDHLVSMPLNLPRANYPTPEVRSQFYERLVPRLATLPGADNAAITTSVPPFGLWGRELLVDGRPDPGRGKRVDTGYVAISPSFFDTVGVTLRRGRPFDARDGAKGGEVAIVNARFASKHFPGEDPIGRRIRFPSEDVQDNTPWMTIVGVSPDIRHGDPRNRDMTDVAYVPLRQVGPGGASMLVRSRLDPAAMVAAVRREVQALDPDQPVGAVRTIDQMLVQASWPFRVFGTIFAILAFIALVMASVGLYSVIAYSVSSRTQEIGVRMALGASQGSVRWLVLRRGLWQIGFGLVIGLAGAWAVGKPHPRAHRGPDVGHRSRDFRRGADPARARGAGGLLDSGPPGDEAGSTGGAARGIVPGLAIAGLSRLRRARRMWWQEGPLMSSSKPTLSLLIAATLIAGTGAARAQSATTPDTGRLTAAALAAAQETPLAGPPARKRKDPAVIGAIIGGVAAAALVGGAAAAYGANEGGSFCGACLIQWGIIAVPAGIGIGAGIGWVVHAASPDQRPGFTPPANPTGRGTTGRRRQVGVTLTSERAARGARAPSLLPERDQRIDARRRARPAATRPPAPRPSELVAAIAIVTGSAGDRPYRRLAISCTAASDNAPPAATPASSSQPVSRRIIAISVRVPRAERLAERRARAFAALTPYDSTP